MNFRPKKKTQIPAFRQGNIKNRGSGRKAADSVEGKSTKNKSEYPAVLSIKLEHGDIVIMHGREIQKLFEVWSLFILYLLLYFLYAAANPSL